MVMHVTSYLALLHNGNSLGRITCRYEGKGDRSSITDTVVWRPLWVEDPRCT